MTSPEYQAPTWVNEDDPDFVEGVSPDLGAGYLNALSGAVEDHGQRLGAAESDVATLQATALDQAGGDARYILQSNASGFAPAEATANALAGKQPLDTDLTALAGLDSATAGTVATDGAGWVKKTYAQLKTALGLATIATSGKLADTTDVTTTGAVVGTDYALRVDATGPLSFSLHKVAATDPAPVAARLSYPGAGLSNGTNMGGTYRYRHTALVESTQIRFAFPGWYNNVGADTDAPNAFTVKASIELPDGTLVPLRFSGGLSAIVNPGALVVSDPALVLIPAGSTFYTRTYVTVAASGQKWPRGTTLVAADGEGTNESATPVDLTTSGTVPATSAPGYGPVAILGRHATPRRTVAIVGSSSAYGTGDTGEIGYLARALTDAGIGYVNLSQGADQLFNWPTFGVRRAGLFPYVTDVICQLGQNDFDAINLATFKTKTIAMWRLLAETHGKVVYQTTLTPWSTSTDNFTTLVNQTTRGSNQRRVDWNNWVRDGAPITLSTYADAAIGATGSGVARMGQAGHPLTGYFEVADVVESSRDSGLFAVDGATANYMTIDGQHISVLGHTLAKRAVTPGRFLTRTSPRPSLARIYKSGNQSGLTDGTTVAVTLGAIDYVYGADLDLSIPNAVKILTPGIYIVASEIYFSSGDSGSRTGIIRVNGSTRRQFGTSGVSARPNAAIPLPLNAGDVVELAVYTTGANSPQIGGGNASDTGLSVMKWSGF